MRSLRGVSLAIRRLNVLHTLHVRRVIHIARLRPRQTRGTRDPFDMNPIPALVNASNHLLLGAVEDPRTRFAAGQLVRLRRGFYVPTHVWIEAAEHERFTLAVTALAQANPATVFCGETALFLRGIPTVKAPRSIEVATVSRGRLGLRPQTFHVSGGSELAVKARGLCPPQVRRHFHPVLEAEAAGEFWVVPVASALAEVLATGKFARALTVADGVLRQEPEIPLLDRPLIDGSINALPYASWRSRASLVASLARAGAESPGESVSRALMLLFGFPEPLLQVEHRDGLGFVGRTDFFWDPGQVAVPRKGVGEGPTGEFDGWGKYFRRELTGDEDPRAIIRKEKRRENRILAMGHPVIRWDWADLERPPLLRAKLREAGLRPTERRLLA